ncbi:G-protein coupled receptor Mth2 isoform X2 [Contarinia nasturtii]|uniref:G-protein coupled receptor Mth2 isoform X2 n=1 Tax=Contarinia nasturtii TaxID=265458 RepID=UPI0012D3FC11|nr:G-protein coupled receptor Mth2 isoform X2 [Contarinia nasturtii]
MYKMKHLSRLYFAFASIIIFSQQIQCDVTKCCPTNSVLKIIDKSCTENETNWDTYNIVASQMPICDHEIVTVPKTVTFIELNGCIDKNENDEFVTMSCVDNPKIGVHLMNKCCSIGYSYDHIQRSCIENLNSHAHFKNMFKSEVVVFESAIPKCLNNEVYVEYHSKVDDIQFIGDVIQVNEKVLPLNKFCIEDLVNIGGSMANEQRVIVRSCQPASVCTDIPCMRRCCSADEIMERNPRRCVPHPDNINLKPIFYDLDLPINEKTQTQIQIKEYGILHSFNCEKMYVLNPNDEEDLHYLHKDGRLYLVDKEPYDQNQYCIENVVTPNGTVGAYAFLCAVNDTFEQPTKFTYYPYGLMTSCVFLALTLIVYLLLPKLLNLHGKTLVCYVTTMLASYITLAILQINTGPRPEFCEEMAYFLLFTLISTFCWQTVMCFDIWLTFGSLRSSFAMRHNRQHGRRFLYYSAYAWLVPLAWVGFTSYAKKYKPFSATWNPNIDHACFFADYINWRPHFLFFIIPAGVHVITNCILFIITAIHCSRVKSDIHRMQHMSDETNTSTKRKKFLMSRAIFMMNLKLFTVMGISWILEIISTFYKNPTVEYIFDTYNIFLGVFIFFIFVFKRKVLYELKIRFGFNSKSTTTGTGSITPKSTTVTNTANISMRDIRSASEKSLPLLTASSTMLQVPSIRK